MNITKEIKEFISKDVLERFIRYVQVYTTSDPDSHTNPSTKRQLDLVKILKAELTALGMTDIYEDNKGFLYATLPGNTVGEEFGLMAHVDTSPDQPGEGVKPRVIGNWDGRDITYPDDPELVLNSKVSPELSQFIGDSIIVASGKTLLGADDKAGVAEIMSALATFKKFPALLHGDIKICFTHDEEIGRGVSDIDVNRLAKFFYTMDGGLAGELEDECFDAVGVEVKVKGFGVHPGYAKDKLINAGAIAARLFSLLSEKETPEHTSEREGFLHLTDIIGDHENATLKFIARDFVAAENARRIENLKTLIAKTQAKYPGVEIQLITKQQYRNMKEKISQYPQLVLRAQQAIEAAGLKVIRRAIRGGTDGSRLTEMGIPTPNIFAGGLMFHSRTEWIPLSGLCKATETILHLAKNWTSH
jgi:tripeptide aminopeptidase